MKLIPKKGEKNGLHTGIKQTGIGNIKKNRVVSQQAHDQDHECDHSEAAGTDCKGKRLQKLQRPVRMQYLRIQRQ